MSTLDNARREARRWLKAIHAGDVEAIRRLHRAHPSAPELPGLRDVQHAVAREHGYESWRAMRAAIDRQTAETQATRFGAAERADAFLAAACPDAEVRGPWSRRTHHSTAMRLLTRYPDIADANLCTRVVCGDVAAVKRTLEADSAAASQAGGPRAWPPLLYLCNTRLSIDAAHENAVAIARALLDHGADPNARYILKGIDDYPYSALAGVLGRGEEEAWTHPRAEPLARLLLERGAEPYDRQLLYNVFADHGSRRELTDDIVWLLNLIYEHALARGRRDDWNDPEWPMLDPWGRGHGAGLLFEAAADRNLSEVADWLRTHGAARHERPTAPPPSDEDSFVAACLRLDRDAASRLLAARPEYRTSPRAMFAAARGDHADVVALLLDLGVSPDVEDEAHTRPLHIAAGEDAAQMISLLIDRGADVDARESNWNATPLGFAVYGQRQRALALLGRVSGDVFNLTLTGNVDRLRELLDREPELARMVNDNGATPLMRLPDDEARAIEIIDLFLAHGADSRGRTSAGKTAADFAIERGMDAAAERLGRRTQG